MTAIRGARSAEGRYVQLRNAAGQDERLSLEARGILYLVLSLPPDHKFTRQWLVDRVAGRNGRRSVDNALAELEEYGYFKRERRSAGRGKWEWEQVLTDDPSRFSSDDNRSDETAPRRPAETPDQTVSPQVSSSDRFSSDDTRPDKELKTVRPKIKDGPARVTPAASPDPAAEPEMTLMIIREVKIKTGRAITAPDAERIAAHYLGRSATTPANPIGFVRACLRNEPIPTNLLPTPAPERFVAPKSRPAVRDESIAAAKAALAHLKQRVPERGGDPRRALATEQLQECREAREPERQAA